MSCPVTQTRCAARCPLLRCPVVLPGATVTSTLATAYFGYQAFSAKEPESKAWNRKAAYLLGSASALLMITQLMYSRRCPACP